MSFSKKPECMNFGFSRKDMISHRMVKLHDFRWYTMCFIWYMCLGPTRHFSSKQTNSAFWVGWDGALMCQRFLVVVCCVYWHVSLPLPWIRLIKKDPTRISIQKLIAVRQVCTCYSTDKVAYLDIGKILPTNGRHILKCFFEFRDHPHEYLLSPTNPQLTRNDTVHCQKGIPGHKNGLCVEDTRPIPYSRAPWQRSHDPW